MNAATQYFNPPRPDSEDVAAQVELARDVFVSRRAGAAGPYPGFLDESIDLMVKVMEVSANLTILDPSAAWDESLIDAARFFGGPMVSQDDLATIVGVTKAQTRKPANRAATLMILQGSLDASRCPWIAERRVPSDAEIERAVYASAVVRATERTRTYFRLEEQRRQERAAVAAVVAAGFTQVPRKSIRDVDDLAPGQCVHGVKFEGKQCDVLVRLRDKRHLAIECKASNSAVNSIKRLNEVADKGNVWSGARGRLAATAAVVAGIYKTANVEDAVDKGILVFWEHDLSTLTSFVINATPR
jgi:hypothetical protein